MAIVTPNPNAIFIHIPKTAGTSITRWLIKHNKGKKNGVKHSDMSQHKLNDKFVFTCVRNPYDWVYSGWSYMKRFSGKGLSLEQYIMDDYMLKMVNAAPQYQYIDVDRIDLILKYETLNKDFKKIQKKFNCDKKLGRLNKSDRRKDWSVMIKDDMKEKIYQTYKTDFEIFNYSL